MRIVLATCMSALLIAAASFAQHSRPDFSGRWRLVEPTGADLADDTLGVHAPDELFITHSPLTITIEHPSQPGTHPEAGTFEYGSGGIVGGLPGRGTSIDERWGVTHMGTQLMISRSMTHPPDERGVRITVTRGSMWRLAGPDQVVIDFSESRSGERPKIATRSYGKIASL